MNNYNRILAVLAMSILGIGAISAQESKGVGIGTANPDPSAVLDIVPTSDNQGLGLPQATPAAINTNVAPAKPKEGLITYDKVQNQAYVYNGFRWEVLGTPRGTIVMWSGSISNIPEGWALCDGKSYTISTGAEVPFTAPVNKVTTPDLRGKFIVAYDDNNSEYDSQLESGGSNSQRISLANLPRHRHFINLGTSTNGLHVHALPGQWGGDNNDHTNQTRLAGGDKGPLEAAFSFTVNSQNGGNHTHNVTGNSNYTGSDPAASFDNRPEYLVLAYIMKI